MGKRRSRKAVQLSKSKIEKLETSFRCPFCGIPDSVNCKIESIDKKKYSLNKIMIGMAECWSCTERYFTKVTHLTEPIDIYSEWIDECEKIHQQIAHPHSHHR